MATLDHVSSVRDIGTWTGDMPVGQVYTAGLAGERFLRELMGHGRFLATRCDACRYTYLPPRLYCERCFGRLDRWLEVGPRGVVRAHTVAHLDARGRRLDPPTVIGLIQLDGADGLLVHYLRGVQPGDVKEGLRVRAVLKPRARRRGSILDIQGFRPV
jgi:uncharacterized OB-fold protein